MSDRILTADECTEIMKAEMPDAFEPKLTGPLKIGAVNFSSGVSLSTVQGAIDRLYAFKEGDLPKTIPNIQSDLKIARALTEIELTLDTPTLIDAAANSRNLTACLQRIEQILSQK